METLILICLLVVIFLLAKDKVVINKSRGKQKNFTAANPELPDIMGQPKRVERHSTSPAVLKHLTFNSEKNVRSVQRETMQDRAIPQEDLDEVFNDEPDLEEEELEWRVNGEPNGEDGFATGVTFEELSTVGALLRQEELEPLQQNQAVDIVKKIQGTELFNLLDNSVKGASKKIASLLDKSLSIATLSASSGRREKGLDEFDIAAFV